jgi:hypothetical protein
LLGAAKDGTLAHMERAVTTVVQAFELLTAPDRPREKPDEYPEVLLGRKGPMSEEQLAAFEASVGWPIPEEYRTLLASCGPFDLRFSGENDIDTFLFLGLEGVLEWRPGLKKFLTKLSGIIPADDAFHAVMTLPVEHLLPATMRYDEDGRSSWVLWERDLDTLYYCHEREGLDESRETLEQYVIEQVAHFARYDLREQCWSG